VKPEAVLVFVSIPDDLARADTNYVTIRRL
jgi:hypothetical protein